MGDLLEEVKTTKKVQSNIEKFESLSLHENQSRSLSSSKFAKSRPIIEVEPESECVPLLTPVSSRFVDKPVHQIVHMQYTTAPTESAATEHKRHDSSAFIQKVYLKSSSPHSLADDAREILKSQPGINDIEAVLSYIQYGMDGQQDFNIKVTGSKASQLIRVLVTTTLPDLWPNLGRSEMGGSSKHMKRTLLLAFFSITGLEALLEQIRSHTRPLANSNREALGIYLDFLNSLLSGSDIVLRLIQDMGHLYAKEVQCKLFWQSVTSLLAGSKVLSTTASIPNAVAESGAALKVPDWLLNGEEYSRWLARNIVRAANKIVLQDLRSWSCLTQLLKRGLSLGYKGLCSYLSAGARS